MLDIEIMSHLDDDLIKIFGFYPYLSIFFIQQRWRRRRVRRRERLVWRSSQRWKPARLAWMRNSQPSWKNWRNCAFKRLSSAASFLRSTRCCPVKHRPPSAGGWAPPSPYPRTCSTRPNHPKYGSTPQFSSSNRSVAQFSNHVTHRWTETAPSWPARRQMAAPSAPSPPPSIASY